MYQNFHEIEEALRSLKKTKIAVAAAADEQVILTIKIAYERGLAEAILVGEETEINEIRKRLSFDNPIEIINAEDPKEAALIASNLVRTGKADVLMKGLVNSSDFLRAILNKERGLRSGTLLSHLAAFEVPGFKKLIFHSDSGMNPAPDQNEKAQILKNAVLALSSMGIKVPKVAVLTANEAVDPKIPATAHAAALVDMWKKGEFPPCLVEGPIAMDVALSPEAAHHKGIISQVSGDVDLFLMPNIETGNAVGKTLMYCVNAKLAGVILGAKNPIVMTSRAEDAEGKLASIALACLIHANEAAKPE